jgi:hypothetical protein
MRPATDLERSFETDTSEIDRFFLLTLDTDFERKFSKDADFPEASNCFSKWSNLDR